MQTIWQVHSPDPPRARALAEALGIHPLTAQLLLNRKLETSDEAARFLRPALEALGSPWALPDMRRAVERLERAIARREPVLIFGDSDVDGLSASVILYEALHERGGLVRARQSNRILDGYGLPRPLAQQLSRSAVRLLVLVDCGTNQGEEIRELAARGIDTIVVDHHVPQGEGARPHALVNPHLGQGAGLGLCSAGLAFRMAQALLGPDDPARAEPFLDLAALGTLADCSPLIGESRLIVSAGLSRIVRSERPGLARLCEATQTAEPAPDQIVRRLVPRLNASGRLGDAAAVWHLLRRDDDGRLAERLASAEAAHATTKQLHRQLIAEAEEQVHRLHFRDQFVMVVGHSGWHQGLMGPLASQLAERYGRPAIAIAMGGPHCTGSARSVPHLNLFAILEACQDLLVRFGGHAQACGLTVARQHLDRFREAVNEQAKRAFGREGLVKTRTIDLELPLGDVAPGWVEEAARFAPFGPANPRPTVAIRRLAIEVRSPRMARLSDGTAQVAARGTFSAVDGGGRYDVVATPSVADGEVVLAVSEIRMEPPPAPASADTGP
ncbi:MAG: DHH family phosphoesterase [Candidatus Omnitrophica bacterium]|nr:DHH family phosphoesterase [Candidatus Omnitrophota bacterium]